MYNIVFYENEGGESDVYNFVMALKAAAEIEQAKREIDEYGRRVAEDENLEGR